MTDKIVATSDDTPATAVRALASFSPVPPAGISVGVLLQGSDRKSKAMSRPENSSCFSERAVLQARKRKKKKKTWPEVDAQDKKR